MKTIIQSVLALVFVLGISNTKAVNSAKFCDYGTISLSEGSRPIIKVKVIFGKGDNCSNKGVCAIVISTGFDSNTSAAFSRIDRTLTLEVEIADLEANQPNQVANLRGTKFVVEADYSLSEEVCNQLGAPVGFVIKAGEYPMTCTGERTTIVIGEGL